MSRVYGRSNDVYQISKKLNETEFNEYKKDNRKCSWDDITDTPEKIDMYLPESAINFLTNKKIIIKKNLFSKYTATQIPDNEKEDRIIKFPSAHPKEEYKKDLMFYMGLLLSSFRPDFFFLRSL